MIPKVGLTQRDFTPSNTIIRGISGADLVNGGTAERRNEHIMQRYHWHTSGRRSISCRALPIDQAATDVDTGPLAHRTVSRIICWAPFQKNERHGQDPVFEKVETIGNINMACPSPHGQHPVPVWPVLHSGLSKRPTEPLRHPGPVSAKSQMELYPELLSVTDVSISHNIYLSPFC